MCEKKYREIDQGTIVSVNLNSQRYRVIPQPYRDCGSKKIDYLYREPAIGQPFMDYVRYRILGQCVDEIKHRNIRGSVAEVGVFKGHFSVKMNELLPDRKLYLYDTFEGFDERDVGLQPDVKNRSWYEWIQNESKQDLISYIKKWLPHAEQVVFRKGYFPDTTKWDTDLTFCLVSIDVDIYRPTLSALEFFYPRLMPGGYIFIHDGQYDGIQQAIREYETIHGLLPIVPICDQSMSYIICKS